MIDALWLPPFAHFVSGAVVVVSTLLAFLFTIMAFGIGESYDPAA